MSLYDRIVLTESTLKGVEDLPDGVVVEISKKGKTIVFAFKGSAPGGPSGSITIGPPNKHDGPCGGAFLVRDSIATRGWGPLLYDVAMEYATKHGSGLASHRGTVSVDARHVWLTYLKKRPDVKALQMTNLGDTKSYSHKQRPETKDDCYQGGALTWKQSPMSKRYVKKNNATTKALKAAGKLVTA